MDNLEIVGNNYFGKYDCIREASRAVIIKDGKILLSYETKHDVWMLPGGGKELGETDEQCIIREVSEETGNLFKPTSLVLEIDEYYEDTRYVSKYFVGTIIGTTEKHLTEQEKEGGLVSRWLPIEEALFIFSKHSEIKDFEEKRGLYLREYTALKEILKNEKKLNLSNVYFVIGTSYAGKSTIVKNLARKHNGIALEENYHDEKLDDLDKKIFPNLTYTRDLEDWHEFIRRTPDEYVSWINNVAKECEVVELEILRELLSKAENQDKKIFVDTNISIETLHEISDDNHVLVMLSDPEIGIHRFFDRPDKEKQFLYKLMLEEPDPQAALDNYREILTRICSKESYEKFEKAGFKIIYRDENRKEEETVELAEKLLNI